MYIFGGKDSEKNKNDLYKLTKSNDVWKWSQLTISGTKPSARSGHIAVVNSTTMYVFGGDDGSKKNDVWKLNLTSPTWSQLTISGTKSQG